MPFLLPTTLTRSCSQALVAAPHLHHRRAAHTNRLHVSHVAVNCIKLLFVLCFQSIGRVTHEVFNPLCTLGKTPYFLPTSYSQFS